MTKPTYEELEQRVKDFERAEAERKKTEEALQESEQRYRNLYESSKDGIAGGDMEGNILECNQAFADMLGYTKEEIKKMTYPELTPKKWHKIETDIVKNQIMARGYSDVYEKEYIRKDGTIFPISAKVWLRKDEKGEAVGMWGIVRDITERKNAEESLIESEEKYRKLVEINPNVIFQINDKGIITFISSRINEIIGFKSDELIGKNISEIIYKDDLNKIKLFNERRTGNRAIKRFELRLIRKEGIKHIETRYVGVNANGVYENEYTGDGKVESRGKAGKFIGTYGTITDITEHRRLEEHLQIRQRMDSLGTLAGGIAHDFNNILTGIMGYINILNLESDGFTETQKEYLKNAEKVCDRAAELINKFETLSNGNISEKTNVDIYETAKEVFDVLKETTNRLIEKKIDIEQGKYYVNANPSELNQVFMNLGTNAVQAIEERGVKQGDFIKITAKEHRSKRQGRTGIPEGEYIHILFEDNGKGMSDEVRRRAFDPLFTTREKSGKRGQGLGLVMVYNIVTRIHNGYIYMESKEGKGTKVHIYLPKAQPEKEAEVDEEVIGIKGGNEIILVVDDEEIILRLAEEILKKCGYNIKTAIDGEQALKIYKKYKDSVDTIILDLTMPRMSGKMVFERMLEINPDVKVIISSGHSDEYAREGLLSKAKGHIKKPYKLTNLAQTVRTVLDL